MTKPGCDPALERFLHEREDLIALARTVVGCPAVAEDLVQDCWLRWRAKAYPSDKARPILMRIVKNLAIDWHRRRKREADGLETQKLHWAEAPDTERIVGARQELALVVRALSECPERTVYAFRLSRLEGLSCAEIGRRLGISESRAYQLVGQALMRVIKALDR